MQIELTVKDIVTLRNALRMRQRAVENLREVDGSELLMHEAYTKRLEYYAMLEARLNTAINNI